MARKRGKMALYEVMSKAQAKADHSKNVEPLQPQKKPEPVVVSVPVAEPQIDVPEPQEKVNWRKKPRMVQYNLGRIEFSIPYQLAITAGLGFVLLLLLAFRVGQFSAGSKEKPVSDQTGNITDNSSDLTDLASSGSTTTSDSASTETMTSDNTENVTGLGDPGGKNVIVIAQHDVLSQLRPVERFFNENGIPTQVYQVGNTYQLFTVDRFTSDPKTPGTTGYYVLEKIKALGAQYEAPQGYESFAPHKFSDAYGRRID